MKAQQFLKEGVATMDERGKDRDAGEERSMGKTVRAFNALTGHDISERDGWLFMAVLKAARAATTPTGRVDDYVDGAAYFALAGESVFDKGSSPNDGN